MNTLRTAFVAIVTTVFYATRILWAAARRVPNLREVTQELPRRWSRGILRAGRVKVELEGTENLPADAPCIIVSNHVSWFDIFAMVAYLPVQYCFVGKVELTKIPFFGPAWMASGHIAIDRSDRKKAIESLREAAEILHRDTSAVIIFPEGTRSADGEMLPFKKGAFVLAAQTGVPLVPVGVSGSRAVMPKGSFRVRQGRIRINIGEPIPTTGRGEAARDQLLEQARAAVDRLRQPRTDADGGHFPGAPAALSHPAETPSDDAPSEAPTKQEEPHPELD